MLTESVPTNTVRKKTGFAGDVLKLVSGTAFAQLVIILASPLLTRLYSPEAFGIFALFTSITGIMGVIACMRYELAIMLPERDEDAANLLGVSLGFVLLITLFSILLVWWGCPFLMKWLNAPYFEHYLWLVPLSILINGIFLAMNYWNSRTRLFSRLSVARVTSSLITTPVSLVLGFIGYATAGSMIGAGIAGQTVATSILGGQIWRDDRKVFFKSIRWREMRKSIIRHKKFPLLGTWSALMNTVSSQLPPLMLATFFSSTVVGFYALGNRLLSVPMILIGGAVAQVFFQRASAAKHDGTLPSVVSKTFMKLIALGLFPILLLMVIGKEIFSVVFGIQWAEAGIYVQILAPWVMFQFISAPISPLFSVLEVQGLGLIFNLFLLATRIASLMIGGYFNNILIALILFSITGTIMYFGLCLLILKKAGLTMSIMIRDALTTGIIGVFVILPIFILKVIGTQSVIIVISGGLSAFLYYSIIYFRDKEFQETLAGFINKLK